MAIDIIKNQPVGFDVEVDSCNTFDQRTYCQMVNQTDDISLVWNASVIGDELVSCNRFEDECCFVDGGETCPPNDRIWYTQGSAYSWSEGFYCADGAGTARQDNFLTELGTYKVIVEIAGYPNDIGNTGTFTVMLGDAQSDDTPAVAGTYIFYLTPTDIGTYDGIRIQSNGGVYCLQYVSVKKVCEDYTVNIKNSAGTIVKTYDYELYGAMTIVNGQFFFQANWADFNIPNGCYTICVVDNCSSGNLVINGSFDEDVNTDGVVDDYDIFDSWDFSNEESPGWNSGGEAKMCHSPGNTNTISQELTGASVGQIYTVSFTMSGRTIGSVTVKFDGVTLGSTVSNGTYTYNATALTTTPKIEFVPIASFDGCITAISAVSTEESCSQCYDLGSHACTKLLAWTNDDDGFGIAYSQVSIIHNLRVSAIFQNSRYPEKIDRFAFSDGTRKILYADGEKIWQLYFDYLPEYLHDAISSAKKHDHFYIDGVEYICSSDNYEPEWRKQLLLAQSKIDVQRVTQQTLNQNI